VSPQAIERAVVPTALSLAAVCRDQKAFGRDFGWE
jgi:hypothetical protein